MPHVGTEFTWFGTQLKKTTPCPEVSFNNSTKFYISSVPACCPGFYDIILFFEIMNITRKILASNDIILFFEIL